MAIIPIGVTPLRTARVLRAPPPADCHHDASAMNLALFAMLGSSGALGVPFYIWAGISTSSHFAQFWDSRTIRIPGQGSATLSDDCRAGPTGALVGAGIRRSWDTCTTRP